MAEFMKKYREKINRVLEPKIWWSLWLGGMLYFSYMLIFYVVLLLKDNYGLPGEIALSDIYTGKLIFFVTNIPLTSFTCLFLGHMTLALYKMNKLGKF
jgi:hypothetical protein